MSSSELSDVSSLSPAESIETDDEILTSKAGKGVLDGWLQSGKAASPSPPPKKRVPSPPHEYVFEDNADIAFVVMFRARFGDAFPRSCPHFGPQDLERGIREDVPDEGVERLLCCLLGLVLNRKKDVEKGHYMRALEEAVQVNTHQWPTKWAGQNPLHGGGNFNSMSPDQRLSLLRALILWALNSSDAVQAILKDSYKQQRHEDDVNQPLSVQPWGRDGFKRRFWLVEGREDTHFRVYRESNPLLKTHTWWSVADSISSAKELADRLQDEGSQAARRLHDSIYAAVPRFEAGEEKRRRRDYRVARRAQFQRPEPGFSLYEGRTRGKRVKYTFSDDEDGDGTSDAGSMRRSNRISGVSTPQEPTGPTFTASGRQVRSRIGGTYGERMHSGQQAEVDAVRAEEDRDASIDPTDDAPNARSSRGVAQGRVNGRSSRPNRYNDVDGIEDESDATSTGNEWDGGDDDDENDNVSARLTDDEDEDADVSDDDTSDDEDDTGKSLLVSLKMPGAKQETLRSQNSTPPRSSEPPDESITVARRSNGKVADGAAKIPMAETHNSARVQRAQTPPAAADDAMDVVRAEDAPPRINGTAPLSPKPTLTNGTIPVFGLDGTAESLHPTKLPFSPKRESPPKLYPSVSTASAPTPSFATPALFESATSTARTSEAEGTQAFDGMSTEVTSQTGEEEGREWEQVRKSEDVPMT